MKTALSMIFCLSLMVAVPATQACETPVSVCEHDTGQGFGLIRSGRPVSVYVDAAADPAVQIVARNFAADLERVSGVPAYVINDVSKASGEIVIIGVAGASPAIDRLVKQGKLKADDLSHQWEAYRQVVVDKPFKNVSRALVIIGSDRRGAVFGTYDISGKIGVSPLYWWDDVPVVKKTDVFITAGPHRDQPKVKYRGLFINDEDPGLKTWAAKAFGGPNAKMYSHVFELTLRLKGNYLWPAMWPPKAFAVDDPQNLVLADQMGVIMGTSHHEPMMRAHEEWAAQKLGKWDYRVNAEALRKFWRGGIKRMMSKGDGKPYESLVTIGMRGDGDEPMSEGTAIELLEGIVKDQRQIITDVTGKPASETPQMWALYKEVQDYYDKGMKAPDDVLLLFADDNWGNIRRLPARDQDRKGGYGIYYHFDYVGTPRNYKWLNTNQIEKTWQQMDLAYRRGADDLWIVNVGDIKPVEFPLQFFLQMAWDPQAMTLAEMSGYTQNWATATFGADTGRDIADILTTYTRYAARRKPELVDDKTFPLGAVSKDRLDGREFGQRVVEWDALEAKVAAVKTRLRPDQTDAYFQLVEHPVIALANYYRLYYYVAWNRKLAAAKDVRANAFADLAEAAFRRDQEITDAYHALKGGKWDGMMLQTHIGYTTWQQPDTQIMPAVTRPALPAGTDAKAFAQKVMAQLDHSPDKPDADIIAIEAPNFSRAFTNKGLSWTVIPNLGRTLGSVTALPQGHESTNVADNIRLEYDVEIKTSGDVTAQLYMLPTVDTQKSGGIKIAVAIDDLAPKVLNMDFSPTGVAQITQQEKDWAQAVRDNAFVLSADFKNLPAGKHTLKIWRIDDNAVLQKLVIGHGKPAPSYLGPAAQ